MTACVALLIAAPASRQGKTTLTAGLARLHARAGRRVQVFKCGPDFLDPYWHELASGRPVYQLDLWINGEQDIRERLHRAAQESDLILIEGVMGLHDGKPSAADIARLLDIPVLCILSAAAMADTFGAVAYGLRRYPHPSGKPLPWAGVLANHVGSERHAGMLRDSMVDDHFWGHLPRDAGFSLPERHLGLVVAQEVEDATVRLDAVADALARTELGALAWAPQQAMMGTSDAPSLETKTATSSDAPAFDRPPSGLTVSAALKADPAEDAPAQLSPSSHPISSWQDWRVDFAPPALQPLPRLLEGKTIAIARDAALCFIYAANLDTLHAMGATVVSFSPLANESLPECDALWLPGGYPELHAETLAQATISRDSVAAHVRAGKPVWAECGGMMLLFETLTQKDGSTQPMWGLLPGSVTMQPRLAALGSQQLDWGMGTLRGHTFHHSRESTPLVPIAHTQRPSTGEQVDALYRHGSIMASYFHAWFASEPAVTAMLFTQMYD